MRATVKSMLVAALLAALAMANQPTSDEPKPGYAVATQGLYSEQKFIGLWVQPNCFFGIMVTLLFIFGLAIGFKEVANI